MDASVRPPESQDLAGEVIGPEIFAKVASGTF